MYQECGNKAEAARRLGISDRALKNRLIQANNPDYPTKIQTGTSTLYDSKGNIKLQWVKEQPDRNEVIQKAILEAIASTKHALPKIAKINTKVDYIEDVVPWIQIGDGHLGVLAYAPEVGENFDLKIAEQELCEAISGLIDWIPNCERLVVNDLGDFTHYENYSAETEASGHRLDFDGRYPKMIRVATRVMRFIVERCLTKAKYVDVIVNQGNHSRTNDIWMAVYLKDLYAHTGRVTVLNNESVFIAYRMGKTLVMTHHSDKCKPNNLANVMQNDYRKDYGETEFHYIDIGHVHHAQVMKEHPGIFIESFNHLAGLDKWGHDSGYRNRKSITVVMRSKTYGEIGRRVLPIQEIRDRLGNKLIEVPKERNVYCV